MILKHKKKDYLDDLHRFFAVLQDSLLEANREAEVDRVAGVLLHLTGMDSGWLRSRYGHCVPTRYNLTNNL